MDRSLIYPGQIPLETDQLNQNRATMIALGKLVAAVLGTGNVVNGLSVSPSSPAALTVVVAPGEIYSLQNVDGTAYSSLPADTTHSCMKQGLSLDPVTLACAAPTTAGYSTNFLIEAAFQEVDGAAVVLPYYNASNPTQAFSGPGNSGNAQATLRQGKVVLQAKAGIAAPTGTQTTPAADAGNVALAVVTVANGQTTITAANISTSQSQSVLFSSLLSMIGSRQFSTTLSIGATTTLNPTQAGSLIVFQGGTLNLPLLSSCRVGASFDILSTFAGNVISAGSDKIQFDGNSTHNASSLPVSGTSFTIVNGGTAWFYLSGTAAFKYSPEFGSLLTSAGYQKNPSGLIEQWGTVNSGSGGVTPITFPMVFPNAALNMSVTVVGTGSASNYQGTSSGPTTTGATLYGLFNGSGASGVPLAWRCIGY